MNPDRQARLDKKLSGLARTRHVPELETGEGPKLSSQLGGIAWLTAKGKWPTCKSCKKPMHMLLQLRAADAPADTLRIPKGKVVQVFHCGRTSCDDGYASVPDGYGKLVRFVAEKGAVRAKSPPTHLGIARRIVGFAAAPELPGPRDARELPVKLNAKELVAVQEGEQRPYGKTKLGGWADWIQSAVDEKCPECSARMQFVLQLDGGDSVELGDVGLAYVLQCPEHHEQLSMSWAST